MSQPVTPGDNSAPGPAQHPLPHPTLHLVHSELHHQRAELLEHITELLQKPMILLSFVWVALMVLDLTGHSNPVLRTTDQVIWALFGVEFVLEFIVAPHKGKYLEQHWLIALSLVLPVLRVGRLLTIFRFLRLSGVARTVTLVRVVASANQGMAAARHMLGRRKVGYVAVIASIVVFIGAAGIYQFENPEALRQAGYAQAAQQGQGISTYADAVWYTAMVLTTIGSAYWPYSGAGRVLTYLLSLFGIGMLGYITAVLASYFVGQDSPPGPAAAPGPAPASAEPGAPSAAAPAQSTTPPPAPAPPSTQPPAAPEDAWQASLHELQAEVAELRRQIAGLTALLETQGQRGQ